MNITEKHYDSTMKNAHLMWGETPLTTITKRVQFVIVQVNKVRTFIFKIGNHYHILQHVLIKQVKLRSINFFLKISVNLICSNI